MTNLILLFQTESQKASLQHRLVEQGMYFHGPKASKNAAHKCNNCQASPTLVGLHCKMRVYVCLRPYIVNFKYA